MRLSLRFIVPLFVVLGLVAYAIVPLVDRLTLQWFVRDLEMRTALLSHTLDDALVPLLKENGNEARIQRIFDRAVQDERLYAVGFCDLKNELRYHTGTFPERIGCENPVPVPEADGTIAAQAHSKIVELDRGSVHVSFQPLVEDGRVYGQLVLIHDMSFIQRRSSETKLYVFYLFAGLAVLISLITVVIAQLSWQGWMRGIRAVMKGEGIIRPSSGTISPEFRPVMRDLRKLIRNIEWDRTERDETHISWTPQALKEILQQELRGDEVLIVSNREPYIHSRKNGKIEASFPASGLVTALEPIMRACSGTWVAHGSGDADREVVDKNDCVRVPPENPSYQIRRVWLSEEEEKGYYYGFANEGLWALCHLAHVRPIFRSQDWAQYVAVNEKFAKAVVEQAKTDDPVILVQDYHFALLPKMIRERLPKATVITFWHIPFPNPEMFGVCPWREEILEGLLGSSILGFHTRFHCNNFLDAVDRFLESRIDRETTTVSRNGNLTQVKHYPISIETPLPWLRTAKPVGECRANIRRMNNFPPERLLGVGVDRLDYTKGILERFSAVERLLELEPKWVGRFTFVQIAAPSRSSIVQYKRFHEDVLAMADRINKRFGSDGYQPICLKVEHHSPEQVYEYFRGSEVCFVSSLHDGMNLVAKEFVASREDEQGVLVLSQFTGAARELPEALIVNPYDTDQCAIALNMALEMPPSEQRNRVRSMRAWVTEYNVFRWAGRMLLDASRLRQRTRLAGTYRNRGLLDPEKAPMT